MRLISLNVWGGKIFEPLMEFVKQVGPETDVFCFQELFFGDRPVNDVNGARANLAEEFQKALPNFNIRSFLAPRGSVFIGKVALSPIGQAIFIKKKLTIVDEGGFYTHSPVTNHSGIFQYLKVRIGGEKFTVGNLHGLWQPSGKRDTSERLKQSKMIKEFYKNQSGKKILCGDLNLRPETKCISMLEENFVNLIKVHGIKSTRSNFYKDADKYRDHIADYVFVSPDTDVINFKVFNYLISDHLPLVLEFK